MREIRGRGTYLVGFKGAGCGGLSAKLSQIGRKQMCEPCPEVGGQRLLALCWSPPDYSENTSVPVEHVCLVLSKLVRATVRVNLLKGPVAADRCPSSVSKPPREADYSPPTATWATAQPPLSDPDLCVTPVACQCVCVCGGGCSLRKNQPLSRISKCVFHGSVVEQKTLTLPLPVKP